MKNALILTLSLLCFACGNGNRFAEFNIEDVSRPHEFLDTVSASFGQHQTMTFDIVGQLDSSAIIEFHSYHNHITGQVKLEKGKVNMVNAYGDYYDGDTLLVKFIPKGSQKGHLKIRTRIN
jgi:hypothetical protein